MPKATVHKKARSERAPGVRTPVAVTLESIQEAAGTAKTAATTTEPLRIIRAAISRVERVDLLELARKYYDRQVLVSTANPASNLKPS